MAEREHRVPIMMSDAELEAVDAYRYANRIGTRSGAIRRLCSEALATPEDAVLKINPNVPNRLLDCVVRVISVDDAHLGVLEIETEQGLIPIVVNRDCAAILIGELASFMAAKEVDAEETIANDG